MKTVIGLGFGVVVAFAVGCGGGVDAVEDGGEGGGGDGSLPSSGSGEGSTTGTGATVGTGTTSTGTTSSSGSGGGDPATECAPSGDEREVVACGFAPNLTLIDADDTSAWVLSQGVSSTARLYRVDLASGERTLLDHDDFSGTVGPDRGRAYAVLDGSAYAVLNDSDGQSVDTGVFRLDPSGRVPVVPFGVTGYTRLLGAAGVLFYQGGQGLDGLWSVPVAGGQPTQWLDFGDCGSCVLSGDVVGAVADPDIGAAALYVAGGEVFRLPDVDTPIASLDDARAREATVDPTSGALLVPHDDGFLGTHRVDRIEPDGTVSTLIEVPDFEGYGPPRFLRARVVGDRVELLFVQSPDTFGRAWRIDAVTGEELSTGPSSIWAQGPVVAHGSWIYSVGDRGGEEGPVEGVIYRTAL